MTSFSDKGVQALAQNFTGTVWVNLNITPGDGYNAVIGTVTFEPQARTNWHTHTSGQILFVIEGTGYYQEKGKPIQIIRKGDVVKIPKNVIHWHGASHNSSMRHVAIITEHDKDQTQWLQPVSEEEYNSIDTTPSQKVELTENAVKNHDELWPNYASKVKDTDPELIEIFDNWAFDDVLAYGNLDAKTRVMMILGSNIACQAITEYKMYVNAALNIGVSPVAIKEILYQSVPYVGIAKAIDFIGITNDIFTERGIELPLPSQATTNRQNREEKGKALLKSIFGNTIDLLNQQSPQNQRHIQQYLAGCFGDYYSRNGLDIKTRELLTFSMLISMGGTEAQVKGHIHGNVNVGNDKETLLSVTTQLLPYIGYPRTLNAIQCINAVIPEK